MCVPGTKACTPLLTMVVAEAPTIVRAAEKADDGGELAAAPTRFTHLARTPVAPLALLFSWLAHELSPPSPPSPLTPDARSRRLQAS